jgi:hypothetical protein
MKVKGTSSLIFISFEENEPFAGRELEIGGELLINGFAAYISGMKWFPPYENEDISDKEKEQIINLIKAENESDPNFKIVLLDDEHNHV